MITPIACNKGQNKKTAINSPLFCYGCNLALPLCPYCKSGIKNIKFCSVYQRAAVFDNKKKASDRQDFIKKSHLIADLTDNIFASCQSTLIAVLWVALYKHYLSLTTLSRQSYCLKFYCY